jgi:uncharacterized protein (UPF0335 family)
LRAAPLEAPFVFSTTKEAGMARKKKQAEPKLGHNGGPLIAERAAQLKGYISEIERWEAEKQEIVDDIGEIYASANDAGFDTKAMRHIVKVRKADKQKQEALEHAVDVYKHALGMLADLPLGQSGLQRAVAAFGTPTDLTEDEKAKGYTAAFIDKDGGRVAIGAGPTTS